MLHLRRANLLDLDCLTVAGERLGAAADWWEGSERRRACAIACARPTASIPTTSS